jgi:hypothetical protein
MAAVKSKLKQAVHSIKKDNERGARTALIEELFYDFHRSRAQVYAMNFVRGLFFGAGSVIGGTVIIALVIWILSMLGTVIPPLGNFFDGVSHTLESGPR